MTTKELDYSQTLNPFAVFFAAFIPNLANTVAIFFVTFVYGAISGLVYWYSLMIFYKLKEKQTTLTHN